MNESILHTCCFFGHRKINRTAELEEKVRTAIENLIVCEQIHTFLFGSKSRFNDLCYDVVSELKEEKYSHIKRVYIRAEFPYINDNYKKYLLEYYEETEYPEKILSAGRAVYVERNYEMINRSKFCICYFDEQYKPSKRKSGTKIAYDYAIRQGRIIYNLK